MANSQNIKSRLFITLLLLGPAILIAQSGAQRKAEKKMAAYDFQAAIQVLEKDLERRVNPRSAALLGECYRLSGRYEEAEKSFQQVDDWARIEPKYLLNFARTLQRNEQYALALTYFQRYLQKNPGDLLAQRQSQACAHIRDLQNKGLGWWEVQPLPLNSEYREFSPAIFDKYLVFSSDRPKEGRGKAKDAWTGDGFLDLYKAARKALDSSQCASYSYGASDKFDAAISSPYHEASAHFSPDFQEIYFTTNTPASSDKKKKASLRRLQIHHARRLPGGRGWGAPVPLSLQSEAYSVMHPCLSPDGRRLYFASDRNGGFGGLDLYYAEKNANGWGQPVNLGSEVNTPGSEAFPYLAPDGRLFFSSDGWPGLGGLDIFIAGKKGSPPFNPGYPLNSAADDFGFIWETPDQCGYLSSDRVGGAGKDDLYVFRKIAHPLEIVVQDAKSGAFIGGVALTADCMSSDTLHIADGRGRWEIPHNACCSLRVEAPGHQVLSQSRCTHNLSTGEIIRISFLLAPLPFYTIEGVVLHQDSRQPIDRANIQVLDQSSGKVAYTFRTDASGRFDISLEGGVCYLIRVASAGFEPFQTQGPCVPKEGDTQRFPYKLMLKPQ